MVGSILSILGALGGIFGGASKAKTEAKTNQNNTALDQFKTELAARIAGTNQQNTRAQSIRTAPAARLGQSATSNMVQNWTPVTKAPYVPGQQGNRISGGFSALGFDPTTKQIAGNNQADALARSQGGWGSADVAQPMTMPNAPTMSSNSWLDKLLGLGGLAGGVAGAVAPYVPKKKPPATQASSSTGGY